MSLVYTGPDFLRRLSPGGDIGQKILEDLKGIKGIKPVQQPPSTGSTSTGGGGGGSIPSQSEYVYPQKPVEKPKKPLFGPFGTPLGTGLNINIPSIGIIPETKNILNKGQYIREQIFFTMQGRQAPTTARRYEFLAQAVRKKEQEQPGTQYIDQSGKYLTSAQVEQRYLKTAFDFKTFSTETKANSLKKRIDPLKQGYDVITKTPVGYEFSKSPAQMKKELGPKEWERQVNIVAVSEAEKELTKPAVLIPDVLNPFGGDIKQPQWMANLNISTVSVLDFKKAEQKLIQNIQSGKELGDILGPRTKAGISFGQAGLQAVMFPITLPQAVIKYTTGKTHILPDIQNILDTKKIRGTPEGLITTGIGEGISKITGEKTDLWERYQKDIFSSTFATGGELAGFYLGGKAVHGAKVTTIKGLGIARSGVLKYTGVNLPGYTKIMYHTPQRILRRAIVKNIGQKEISTVMNKPFISTKTLNPGGLSFAPGKTPAQRITWTINKTEEAKLLSYSEGNYLLGSASSRKLGMSYTVKGSTLHELPSMSFTPYGYTPTRFFRFTPSGLSYSSSTSLLPSRFSPTGIITKIKEVYKPPTGTYEDIGKWGLKQQKGSWAVISPKMYLGGAETELNVFGSKMFSRSNKTVLKRYLPDKATANLRQRLFGYQYYADVPLEGGLTEVVPVKFTKILSTGKPTGVKLLLGETKTNISSKIFGSRTGIPTSSILSYGSIGSILSKPISYSKSLLSSLKSASFVSIPSFPSGSKVKEYNLVSSLSRPSRPSITSYSNVSSISKPSRPSRPSITSYSNVSSISKPSRISRPNLPSYKTPPPYYYDESSSIIKRKLGFIRKNKLIYRFRMAKMPRNPFDIPNKKKKKGVFNL